jgi:hypothetical protein
MGQKVKLDQDLPHERYGFDCPGCKGHHQIRTTGADPWGFNGNLESPTFTPSILVRSPQGRGKPDYICHSFVTDGKIQFLGDCSHALAGQTVELADI